MYIQNVLIKRLGLGFRCKVNQEERFTHVNVFVLKCFVSNRILSKLSSSTKYWFKYEPVREKTNNVVSEQV